jgi:uncharacterized membrane-anchored protein
MRRAIAVVASLVVLAVVNWTIHQRERSLEEGRVVLLELAPVDPRSLMQGDYMALRFRMADDAVRGRPREEARDGLIVAGVDASGVGSFRRLKDETPLKPDEVVMRYRVRNGVVKFATNAWFFQEGHARYYEQARYGEFRVAPDGDLLLTAMRGAKLEKLGPPAR